MASRKPIKLTPKFKDEYLEFKLKELDILEFIPENKKYKPRITIYNGIFQFAEIEYKDIKRLMKMCKRCLQ